MAPFNKFVKNTGKHPVKNIKPRGEKQQGFKNKPRKWVPEGKTFDGSVQEGQGFAYRRKQKAQHAYNKLLHKERRKNPVKTAFEHDYPEHLKHLYQAEADQLRKEELENQRRRRRTPAADDASVEDTPTSCTAPGSSSPPDPPLAPPEAAEKGRFNQSKKTRKLTSYQKTREEYERMKEKRAKKKEEAERNRQQREEALKIYKQKKSETYQMLCKKTKKGQPNLNLQMEHLLLKLQNKAQDQTK